MLKAALTPRSQALIKNYLAGGAAIGGSAGLITSLVNYLQTLKAQAPKDEAREDDDTLYINVNDKAASAGIADYAAGGVAMTGGVLSTLGTYALVRKLYQNMKKKQLQEELDKAQQTFVGTAEQEAAVKNAASQRPGVSMGLGELMWSSPTSFLLLSAIASGALTNTALSKTFPRIKKPTDVAPKRVVVRKNKSVGEEDKSDNSDEKQAASYDSVAEDQQYEDGLELVIGLTMGSKKASESDLVNIVYAVGQGRHDEFVNNMLDFNFDTAVSLIKGAADVPMSQTQKQLAISTCVKSAALKPVVALLAAAEYNDMAPRFTAVAGLQSADSISTLCKIAGVLGAINRAEVFAGYPIEFDTATEDEKSAAATPSLEEILHILTSIHNSNGTQPDTDSKPVAIEDMDNLGTEDSLDSSTEKQVNDTKPLDNKQKAPETIDKLDDEDDFVDAAMSRPTTPAKAMAAQSN